MEEIKAGDLVKLASGGPVMTVTKIERNNVSVVWFDDNKVDVYRSFSKEILIKVDADKEQ